MSKRTALTIVFPGSSIFCSNFKVDLFGDILVSSLGKMHFVLGRQSSNDHRTGVFVFVFILVRVFNEKERVASP